MYHVIAILVELRCGPFLGGTLEFNSDQLRPTEKIIKLVIVDEDEVYRKQIFSQSTSERYNFFKEYISEGGENLLQKKPLQAEKPLSLPLSKTQE